MKKSLYLTFIILVILIGMMFVTSCTPKNLPDLIPVDPNPSLGGLGFCDTDHDGNLLIHIKNQGTAPAGSTTVRVDFGQYGYSAESVPAIGAGETVTVSVQFPATANCYDPDCNFEITVDITGVVEESNEMNNTDSGWCLG